MLKVDIKKNLAEFTLNTTFTAEEGILAILGRSGSGKTMTLKCIAGLVTPDAGSITLNDRVLFDKARGINLKPQYRNTGFVFQNYALFPHMTCFENVAFGLGNIPKQEMEQKTGSIMERLKIHSLAARRPGQISGGQQQRVALARALVTSPDILLLDEPFSALDTITKESLQRLLLEVEQFYSGHVILVTHNLAEAYRLSSRIAVYETGELLQIGTKQEVLSNPASSSVAALTGVRNLWKVVVEDAAGDQALLKVPDTGVRLWAHAPHDLQIGEIVTVGFRSEEANLIEFAGDNTVPVMFSKAIEEISSYTVVLELLAGQGPNLPIETVVPKNTEIPSAGHRCWLHIPPEKMFIIP